MYPKAAEAFVSTIIAILNIIADNTKSFVDAGYLIVTEFLRRIEENVPKLQMAALVTVLTIINGMTEALDQNGHAIINAFMALMGQVILLVIDAGVEMVNALFGWVPGVKEATAGIGMVAEQYIRDNFNAGEAGVDKGI